MSRERAFTLVELLVTLSAGSAMMVMAISTVHQAMQFSTLCRDRADAGRSMARLAEQLRYDVHRAEKATVDSEQSVTIRLPDGSTVTYKINGNRVTREQPLASGETWREVYRFSEKQRGKFSAMDDPKRVMAVIEFDAGLKNFEPRIDRQIAVVVGRMRRCESTGAATP